MKDKKLKTVYFKVDFVKNLIFDLEIVDLYMKKCKGGTVISFHFT